MDTHFGPFLPQTHAEELRRRLARQPGSLVVLDSRPAAAHRRAHIPGARHLRVEDLTGALPDGLAATTEIVIAGAGFGDPASRALALALQRLGARRLRELAGGFAEWRAVGGPTEGEAVARAA